MQNIMPIRPPEKLKEWLKKEAKEQGFTVNGLILNILWDYYKKEAKINEPTKSAAVAQINA